MSKNTSNETEKATCPVNILTDTELVNLFVNAVVKASATSELLAHLQGLIDAERNALDPFRAVRGKSWTTKSAFRADASVPQSLKDQEDSGDMTLSKGDGGLRLVLPMNQVPVILIQAPKLSGQTVATRNRIIPR